MGISLLSPQYLEARFFDETIVDRDILNGLEKWYIYTQIVQFFQEFSLLRGVLTRVDEALRKRRLLDLSVTFFIFLLNLYRWRWRMVVWEYSSRSNINLLYIHNIS